MALKSMFDKLKGGNDYVEVEHEEEAPASNQLMVEIERLDSYNDAERVQRKIRDGIMMLVKIKDLKAKDIEELKRSVEKVRRTCLAVNGDIAGLGDDWLVVTPASAKIHREQEAS